MSPDLRFYADRKADRLTLRLRTIAFALDAGEAFTAEDRAALEKEAAEIERSMNEIPS